MMSHKLSTLEVDTLKEMYEEANAELKRKLLDGIPWEKIKDQRKRVTEIASALHKKSQSAGLNPAESTSADMEGR